MFNVFLSICEESAHHYLFAAGFVLDLVSMSKKTKFGKEKINNSSVNLRIHYSITIIHQTNAATISTFVVDHISQIT